MLIDWTEEKVRELVHMYTRKHTLLEISTALGVSRSAIAGKIRRMRITRETKIGAIKFTPRVRTKAVKEIDTPPKTACSMDELKPDQCRWPYGDRETGYKFCAETTESGVYCKKHADISRGRKCKVE